MSFYSISGTATPPGITASTFAKLAPGASPGYSAVSHLVTVGQVCPLSSNYGGTASGAVTTWQLRSWTGIVVASGGAIGSNGNWTVPSVPYGWYRLYFYNGSGTYMGGDCIIVARTVSGMPTTTGSGDWHLGARLLIGAWRLAINDASNPSADYAGCDLVTSELATAWLPFDTARPKHGLLAFPNGTAGKESGVTAAVTHFGTGIDFYEGANEPSGVPDGSFAPIQQAFYTAVKAGRSAAKVLGPCPVSVGGGSDTTRLNAFGAAGGFAYCDQISFHNYNSSLGDLVMGRRSFDNLVSILTSWGVQSKPRVITEAASFFAAEYGAGAYIRQAVQTMLDLFLSEQYGIQKEQWWYFYARSMGFDSYPSWLVIDGGAIYPAAGCLLTHSQELLGTTWEARHDFGTIDNNSLIGSSYRRADTTGVVSVLACGRRSASVSYQITGGSPSSLTLIDCWGNSSTVTVTGGIAKFNATLLPQYLRLPAGVTATPVDGNTRYGTSRFASAIGYVGTKNLPTVNLSDTATRADGAVGGAWTSFGAGSGVIASNRFTRNGGNFTIGGIQQALGADGRIDLQSYDSQAGIVFRYQDADNFWALYDSNLWKVVGGTRTVMGGLGGSTVGAQTVILAGSSILAYAGGVQLANLTDTTFQSATRAGVYLHTTSATASDFVFTTGSEGSAGSTSLDQVLHGSFRNSLFYGYSNNADGQSVWNARDPLTSGTQTLTVEAPSAETVDTILIHCPPPWQDRLTVLKDFDVQTWNGSSWVTQQTVTEATVVVLATSTKQEAANAFYDSFWDDRHVFEVKFATPVTTIAVRLNVREITYGAIPTAAARDASGNPADLAGIGTITPRMAIQRLTVFDSTSSSGGGDGGGGTDPDPDPGTTPAVSTGKFVVKATAFA